MDKEQLMRRALKQAQIALDHQEVAVGCVFVHNDQIIAEGRNTVNETKNPTRHAELNCIDQVLKNCEINSLNSMDVFKSISVIVTVEPCVMCAEALHNVGVSEVIYGCKNDRFGGSTVFDLSSVRTPSYNQEGGLLADEAMSLLKKFYAGSNPAAPAHKRAKPKKADT